LPDPKEAEKQKQDTANVNPQQQPQTVDWATELLLVKTQASTAMRNAENFYERAQAILLEQLSVKEQMLAEKDAIIQSITTQIQGKTKQIEALDTQLKSALVNEESLRRQIEEAKSAGTISSETVATPEPVPIIDATQLAPTTEPTPST